jgi:hypothetical protein
MEAMEMERPMTEWNEDRLDELNGRVKEGFAGVDQRFDKVDERFARVDQRFDKVDERFARVDQRFDKVDERFARVDQRFDKVDERFAQVDERFAQVDRRFEPLATREEVTELRAEMNGGFDRLNDRLDHLYYAFIVAALGLIGTLLANGIWG